MNVLGLELSFSADVSSDRMHNAVSFVEQRYSELEGRASHLSKERLLTYLVLGLADDYLHDQDKLQQLENTLQQLVSKIDSPEE
ncbi:cell division protein ZapA [Desulfovibrionales bacterium]